MRTRARYKHCIACLIGLACTLGAATPARADGFISPLVGADFGGDSNCPVVGFNCRGQRLNYGIGIGVLGSVLGFEEEFSYAPDFIGGTALNVASGVLTAMSSVMLAPKIGPVRPYVLAGVGLIKTHVDFTPASLTTSDNNLFGWDVGGGVMLTLAPHVGVRGDLRYFHSFQELNVPGFSVQGSKFDFGRAAGAVIFTF